MSDLMTLASHLTDRCRLTGSFALSSGGTSPVYWDKMALLGDPYLRDRVTLALAALVPRSPGPVAGRELGGALLAMAVATTLALPLVVVRKGRPDHGTRRLIEGPYTIGQSVTLIEDIVTTGASLDATLQALAGAGLTVVRIVCVIDRGATDPPMAVRSLFHVAGDRLVPHREDVA